MNESHNPHAGQVEQTTEKNEVKIDVDNHPKHVLPGTYVVSKFKALVDVPADKELEEVINGILTPLTDDASIRIHGGEVCFSHVRRGGASWL
jgi:hypothetical protein